MGKNSLWQCSNWAGTYLDHVYSRQLVANFDLLGISCGTPSAQAGDDHSLPIKLHPDAHERYSRLHTGGAERRHIHLYVFGPFSHTGARRRRGFSPKLPRTTWSRPNQGELFHFFKFLLFHLFFKKIEEKSTFHAASKYEISQILQKKS